MRLLEPKASLALPAHNDCSCAPQVCGTPQMQAPMHSGLLFWPGHYGFPISCLTTARGGGGGWGGEEGRLGLAKGAISLAQHNGRKVGQAPSPAALRSYLPRPHSAMNMPHMPHSHRLCSGCPGCPGRRDNGASAFHEGNKKHSKCLLRLRRCQIELK